MMKSIEFEYDVKNILDYFTNCEEFVNYNFSKYGAKYEQRIEEEQIKNNTILLDLYNNIDKKLPLLANYDKKLFLGLYTKHSDMDVKLDPEIKMNFLLNFGENEYYYFGDYLTCIEKNTLNPIMPNYINTNIKVPSDTTKIIRNRKPNLKLCYRSNNYLRASIFVQCSLKQELGDNFKDIAEKLTNL